jgi:hypothetical protein
MRGMTFRIGEAAVVLSGLQLGAGCAGGSSSTAGDDELPVTIP